MPIWFLAALQAQVVLLPSTPAIPARVPFTEKVETTAQRISLRVNDEFKRCGDARTSSNSRSVEAFGTLRFSAEWAEAARAMKKSLEICRGLRRELRQQKDFLIKIARNGAAHDAPLAADELANVSYELEGLEQFFATETLAYRKLIAAG